ncbi:hypothetical protein MSG28_006084 [Choristoneura fumiferana]|uniref:Uncharacterized protein n=1 Tax=Choristoneura fumiferana TaxID=7141 RepID=A0ACC0JDM3_CHOFU|nr:hypothetical protein MSG28_006084 [Choristoneura fumiferana]
MALKQSREVPKDAVVLDEIEATNYVWEVVSNWDSLSDTWALRYAPMVLGGVSAISGIIINDHYRKKLKLGNFGFFSSVIPISIMPGLMTALFHRHTISTNMLLMKNEGCPVCYEIRSAVIQWGFGVAYPMVLGPTSALMFASRYSTYRVPNLAEGPKVVFGFLSKLTKPLHTTLVYMGAFQLVLSSVLTYFEMKNHISMSRKIEAIESKVLEEHELA